VTGRKRHVVVDTLGLLLAVVVHAADLQDRDGAKLVLAKLVGHFPRLQLIWADGGYGGALVAWVQELGGWVLEIVRRREPHGFEVLPRRWVVERTFAWLGRYRRLSKDYEALAHSSEVFIYIATVNMLVHRLKPG
jgi:putative transposase